MKYQLSGLAPMTGFQIQSDPFCSCAFMSGQLLGDNCFLSISRAGDHSLTQYYSTSWIPLQCRSTIINLFFCRKHSTALSEVKLILCSQCTLSQRIRVKCVGSVLMWQLISMSKYGMNWTCCLGHSTCLVRDKMKQLQKLTNSNWDKAKFWVVDVKMFCFHQLRNESSSGLVFVHTTTLAIIQ